MLKTMRGSVQQVQQWLDAANTLYTVFTIQAGRAIRTYLHREKNC